MLLLNRAEVASLLTLDDYICVVEQAFRRHAEGGSFTPALAHVDAEGGEFHIKAGGVRGDPPYFGLKVNGGFFQNRARYDLPNIQGLIVLSRADNGVPLAVMDSIEITIQRTGAATAVAARRLARPDSRVATVCGCGNQARIQLRALTRVLPLERVYAWSPVGDRQEAQVYAARMAAELGIEVEPVENVAQAIEKSDVCITCTPSRLPFLKRAWIHPGMSVDSVHAEIGEVLTGSRPGRTSDDELFLYDSTGTALQDVAAAAAVYERAREHGCGSEWQPS
jgi:ornithine cyclodeaminase/alanine dehydrogenase